MASPQTHGLATILILIVFLILAVFGLTGELTFLEYLSAIIWGVLIDLEHFLYLSYFKDIIPRIIRGGGMPSKKAQSKKGWLHMWPGLIVVIIYGLMLQYIDSSSRWWFPLIFWGIHLVIDQFQKSPRFSFFWPLPTKQEMPPPKWAFYPVKPPWEFMLNSAIWMSIGFILLGLLIVK